MFESLSGRAVPMPYGWLIQWADGRSTRVEVAVLPIAPGGEKAVHKTIRWAA